MNIILLLFSIVGIIHSSSILIKEARNESENLFTDMTSNVLLLATSIVGMFISVSYIINYLNI